MPSVRKEQGVVHWHLELIAKAGVHFAEDMVTPFRRRMILVTAHAIERENGLPALIKDHDLSIQGFAAIPNSSPSQPIERIRLIAPPRALTSSICVGRLAGLRQGRCDPGHKITGVGRGAETSHVREARA